MTSPAAQRLRLALDMYEAGEQMMRQRIRRDRPTASAQEVEAEVSAWLLNRPPDSPGRASRRFE